MLRFLHLFSRCQLLCVVIALLIAGTCWYLYQKIEHLSLYRHLETTCPQLYDVSCVENVIVGKILENNLSTGMLMLRDWYMKNTEFRPFCDALTRAIGRSLVETERDFLSLSPTPTSVWCNYGIYHGYIEAFLEKTHDLTSAQRFCITIAKEIGDGAPGMRSECFRAIGYGVSKRVAQDIHSPREIVSEALALCSNLSPTPTDRTDCISGIFSELGRIVAEGQHGQISQSDPLELCGELNGEVQTLCFASMKWLPLITFNLTNTSVTTGLEKLKRTFDPEAMAEQKKTIEQLIWTMSYNDARRGTALDTEKSYTDGLHACMNLPPLFQKQCIQGFAFGLAKGGEPGNQYRNVIDFCRFTASVSDETMHWCPEAAIAYLREFYSAQRFVHVCRNFKGALGASC